MHATLALSEHLPTGPALARTEIPDGVSANSLLYQPVELDITRRRVLPRAWGLGVLQLSAPRYLVVKMAEMLLAMRAAYPFAYIPIDIFLRCFTS